MPSCFTEEHYGNTEKMGTVKWRDRLADLIVCDSVCGTEHEFRGSFVEHLFRKQFPFVLALGLMRLEGFGVEHLTETKGQSGRMVHAWFPKGAIYA